MKRSKFTEEQIAFALKQSESGVLVAEVCRITTTDPVRMIV
ncbi:transposase [Acinetobacter sp. WZC-1]